MIRNSTAFYGGIVALMLLALGVYTFGNAQMKVAGEIAMFSMFPTAERAYTYGSRHFDAEHPDFYDIDRAENFFLKANSLEPGYPYLQHQLARIAFLRGDFSTALFHINKEIEMYGESHANAYYVRGLILGFAGEYEEAVKEYQKYLQTDPTNWAATNDLAWVLLKAERSADALLAIDRVLHLWPDNPWLLNSKATALFELGRLEDARVTARNAVKAVMGLTEAEWLEAYPGNDPLIAHQGMLAFQSAIVANMHSILVAGEKREKDMR